MICLYLLFGWLGNVCLIALSVCCFGLTHVCTPSSSAVALATADFSSLCPNAGICLLGWHLWAFGPHFSGPKRDKVSGFLSVRPLSIARFEFCRLWSWLRTQGTEHRTRANIVGEKFVVKHLHFAWICAIAASWGENCVAGGNLQTAN